MNGISPRKAELLEAHRIRWEFGFNDPTIIGWMAVAGYLTAAVLAWRAAKVARRGGSVVEQRFWLALCAALAFLAVNKQLDLHILITDIGRYWSVQHDLYQQRRVFQKLFMIALAFAIAFAGLVAWLATRDRDSGLRVALAGIAVCCGYILIRAASFHHTDVFMRSEIFGWRWNGAVELVGIALTIAGALRYRPRDPRRAPPITG